MRITRKAEYAMIFMEELAEIYENGMRLSAGRVAEKHHLSRAFMRKVTNILQEKKLIIGEEGMSGGYRLAKNPKDITITQIMSAIDEPFAEKPCCDKYREECSREAICPHKSVLYKLQWALEATYGATSLDKIVKGELSCSKLWKGF